MNDNAIHKAIEAKGIDLSECRFSFSRVNSPRGVPDTEGEFNNIDWHDHDTPPVTWDEVKTKGDELDAEFIANEYQRDREPAYPLIADQLDMLYHAIKAGSLDTDSEFFTTLKAVKDAHPKP